MSLTIAALAYSSSKIVLEIIKDYPETLILKKQVGTDFRSSLHVVGAGSHDYPFKGDSNSVGSRVGNPIE